MKTETDRLTAEGVARQIARTFDMLGTGEVRVEQKAIALIEAIVEQTKGDNMVAQRKANEGNREKSELLSEWQKFAANLSKILGCIAITDDLLKSAKITVESRIQLCEALIKCRHALTWSEPHGGESCEGTITNQEAFDWHDEACNAADDAIGSAKSTP